MVVEYYTYLRVWHKKIMRSAGEENNRKMLWKRQHPSLDDVFLELWAISIATCNELWQFEFYLLDSYLITNNIQNIATMVKSSILFVAACVVSSADAFTPASNGVAFRTSQGWVISVDVIWFVHVLNSSNKSLHTITTLSSSIIHGHIVYTWTLSMNRNTYKQQQNTAPHFKWQKDSEKRRKSNARNQQDK